MTFLLYSSASETTGRRLAKRLGIPCGDALDVYTDTLIRWGSTRPVQVSPGRVLNPVNAVRRACNKAAQVGGVFLEGLTDPSKYVSMHGPVVARTKHHRAGSGLWLCLCQRDLYVARCGGADYFVPYLQVAEEYRVHLFGNRVIFVQIKEAVRAGAHPWVHTHACGWTFSRVKKVDHDVVLTAQLAATYLDMDFCAVDVVVTDDHDIRALEVNSAPALTGPSLRAWVATLKEVLNV